MSGVFIENQHFKQKYATCANGERKITSPFRTSVRRNIGKLATYLYFTRFFKWPKMRVYRNTLPVLSFKKLITSLFILKVVVKFCYCFEGEIHFH